MPILANRYQLEELLGEGGMGAVYKAVDRLTGDFVAVKRVFLRADKLVFTSTISGSGSNDHKLALAQEFQLLASLRHPNIIDVLDYGFDDDGFPFFTMSLLAGVKNIKDIATDVDMQTRATLIIQVLQALKYLHRRGIIHRDLKPQNVLVDSQHRAKVLDFGLAIHAEDRLATANHMAGTLYYMAPEFFRGDPASIWTDLYAVGVIAYEVFTGEFPYKHDNVTTFVQHVAASAANWEPLKEYDIPFRPGVLSIADIIKILLAKEPEQRFQTAHEVIEHLSAAVNHSVPIESIEIRESYLQASEFVGRDAELHELETALDAAVDGKGSSWLIGGESGVGKSRLMEEIRTKALIRGILVLRGQAKDSGSLPYHLWRNLLKRLVLSTEISDLEAAILKEVIPDIDKLLEREVEMLPDLEADAQKLRLLMTIVELFKRYSRPIVLLLEDIQWAYESLEPLQQLNRVVSEMPLLILASYRNDERPELVDELPDMQYIQLERLNREQIARVSTSMLGEAGQSKPIIDLLHKETEGNPFFILEVVRALADHAGNLDKIGLVTLPPAVFAGGIHDILHLRLSRLPDDALPLLKCAAVIGRQFDIDVLASMSQGQSIEEWLTACANVAVIERQDDLWQFTHDKLRNFVLSSMDDNERRHLNGQAARAFEKVYGERAKDLAASLARLWLRAGDVEQSARYTHLAAEKALATSSYFAARDILENLLPIVENGSVLQASIEKLLGDTYRGLSQYKTAMQHYGRSISIARQHNYAELVADALVGLSSTMELQGQFDEALAYLGQILESSGTDLRRQAWALLYSGKIYMRQGNDERAREHYQRTLSLMRSLKDSKGIAACLDYLGIMARRRGDYQLAGDHFKESLQIRESINDRQGIAATLDNLGDFERRQRNFDGAYRYHQDAKTIYEEVGNLQGKASCLDNMGLVAMAAEDSTAARAYHEESLSIYQTLGDRWGLANCMTNLMFIELNLGLVGEARNHAYEALGIARDLQAAGISVELLSGFAHLSLLDNDLGRCLEICGLVQHHPATSDFVRRVRIQPLLAQLEEQLPPHTIAHGLEQGKKLRLWHTVSRTVDRREYSMNIQVHIKPPQEIDPETLHAIHEEQERVFPTFKDGSIEWSIPTWRVVLTDEHDWITTIQLHHRTVVVGDMPVNVVGIGGVVTVPAYRHHGYATLAMERAHTFIRKNTSASFGLLFCGDRLIPFYERVGWRTVPGHITYTQSTGDQMFGPATYPMIYPFLGDQWPDGDIHLCGLPF
ncbi:MAG: GNAT family N-acetyltransferase [Chloroflexi bacterium]|nr:GNAT family N-acetyltransferase [Chloroflexota bacterium]